MPSKNIRANHYFKAADLGIDGKNMRDWYAKFTIHWEERHWNAGEKAPLNAGDASPCIYAIITNHGKSREKGKIQYIGISTNAKARFLNHPTAHALRDKKGKTSLCLGVLESVPKKAIDSRSMGKYLNAIEHLLIWYFDCDKNIRKVDAIPKALKGGAMGWHIENTGYDFCGRMPSEILYPWMLVKPRRDRSAKSAPG